MRRHDISCLLVRLILLSLAVSSLFTGCANNVEHESTHTMREEQLNDPMREFEQTVETIMSNTSITWNEAVTEDGYNAFGSISEEPYNLVFSISSTIHVNDAEDIWEKANYPTKVAEAGGRSFLTDNTVLVEETGDETVSIRYVSRVSDNDMFYVVATVALPKVEEVYSYINILAETYGTPIVEI